MKGYYNTITLMLWMMYLLSMSKITENHSLNKAQVQTLRVDLWNFTSFLNALVLKYHDSDSLLGSKFVYFQGVFLRLTQNLNTDLRLYWGLLDDPIKHWYDISQAIMIGMNRDEGLDYLKEKYKYLAVSLESLSGCAVVPDAVVSSMPKVLERHFANMHDIRVDLWDQLESDNTNQLKLLHFACIAGIERTLGIIKQLATYQPYVNGEPLKCYIHKDNVGLLNEHPAMYSVLTTTQGKILISHLLGFK